MSGDPKRNRTATTRRPGASQRTKLTANVLIAEATSSRFKLSREQIDQVKVLLEHNDACDTPKTKVSLVKAWRFLKQHYGLKMGVHMFERLLCDELGRSSWGQQ